MTELNPTHFAQWRSHGYVVLRGLLSGEEVAAARRRNCENDRPELDGFPAVAQLVAELMAVDSLTVRLTGTRVAHGVTAEATNDDLIRSTGIEVIIYLTDVTLNDGPLFLVSASAASQHVDKAADANHAARLWELPVCAPAGTVVVVQPNVLNRLANRRIDGERITDHATLAVAGPAPSMRRSTDVVGVGASATHTNEMG